MSRKNSKGGKKNVSERSKKKKQNGGKDRRRKTNKKDGNRKSELGKSCTTAMRQPHHSFGTNEPSVKEICSDMDSSSCKRACRWMKNVKKQPLPAHEIHKYQKYEGIRTKNARRLGELSFKAEEKLEERLTEKSSRLLTALSLVSAIIVLTFQPFSDSDSVKSEVVEMGLAALGLLMLSMFFALLALYGLPLPVKWTHTSLSLATGKVYLDYFEKNFEVFTRQSDFDRTIIHVLDELQSKKVRENGFRYIVIFLSWILFSAALIIAFWSLVAWAKPEM